MQYEFLPFLKPPREIAAVKEPRVNDTRPVADRYVENGTAPPHETHRSASAAGHFGADCVDLARNNLGDLRELNAILVSKGEITEEVADRGYATLF
jgi:hypothetical protein